MFSQFFGESNNDLSTKISVYLSSQDTAISSLVNHEWQTFLGPITARNNRIHDLLLEAKLPARFTQVHILSGGQTNQTFKITPYVIRLVGNTESIIDREYERKNVDIVSKKQLNARVYHTNQNGDQVSEFIEGVTMSPELLKEESNLHAAVELLKEVHRLEPFVNDVNVFDRNRHFLSVLEKHNAHLACDEKIASTLSEIESVSAAFKAEKVPSHNDTVFSNFIMSVDGNMKLIDWEYSGNNTGGPLPDLADKSFEAGFSPEDDRRMLKLYFGEDNDITYFRLLLYKATYAYYVNLWARVQLVNENYSDEATKKSFEDLADKRLDDYTKLVSSELFNHAMQALRLELDMNKKTPSVSLPSVYATLFYCEADDKFAKIGCSQDVRLSL